MGHQREKEIVCFPGRNDVNIPCREWGKESPNTPSQHLLTQYVYLLTLHAHMMLFISYSNIHLKLTHICCCIFSIFKNIHMGLHRFTVLSLALWVVAIHGPKFLHCKFSCLPKEWRMDRTGRAKAFSELSILVAGPSN